MTAKALLRKAIAAYCLEGQSSVPWSPGLKGCVCSMLERVKGSSHHGVEKADDEFGEVSCGAVAACVRRPPLPSSEPSSSLCLQPHWSDAQEQDEKPQQVGCWQQCGCGISCIPVDGLGELVQGPYLHKTAFCPVALTRDHLSYPTKAGCQ